MKYIRYIAAESLRMYPEPPLLIRRALEDDELPPGSGGPDGLRPKITRGVDLFLAIYNLHRSPDFWENPDAFDPDRFDRPFQNKGVDGWAGFDPKLLEGQLYPNEVVSDFAYLPFGGEEMRRHPLVDLGLSCVIFTVLLYHHRVSRVALFSSMVHLECPRLPYGY